MTTKGDPVMAFLARLNPSEREEYLATLAARRMVAEAPKRPKDPFRANKTDGSPNSMAAMYLSGFSVKAIAHAHGRKSRGVRLDIVHALSDAIQRIGADVGATYAARAIRRITEHEGTLTKDEWETVFACYGRRCLSCRSTNNISIDHIIPISKGGQHNCLNVQPLCRSCNSKKGARCTDYRPFPFSDTILRKHRKM